MRSFVFPKPSGGIDWTGERFILGRTGEIEFEHYHRYLWAAQFCNRKKVLDIACGEGYGSALLSQVAESVTGVDIDPTVIHRANEIYGAVARFVQGSVDKIPVPTGTVDVVVCFETLEHVDKHDVVFSEIKRVLVEGGLLVISTPDRPVYASRCDGPNPFHLRELDRTEFLGAVNQHFSHTMFGAQKATTGSVMWPISNNGAKAEFFRRVGEGEYACTSGLDDAPYLLAVASDKPLRKVRWGLLDDGDFLRRTQLFFMSEHDRLKAICQANEAEITRVNSAWGEANSEIVRLNSAVEAADSEIRRVNAAFGAAHSEIVRLNYAWGEANSEIARVNSVWQAANSEIGRLNAVLVVTEIEVVRAKAASQETEAEMSRLRSAWGATEREIARLDQELAAERAQSREVAIQLNAIRAAYSEYPVATITRLREVEGELSAVLKSRSWQVTRPIRALRTALSKKRDRLSAMLRVHLRRDRKQQSDTPVVPEINRREQTETLPPLLDETRPIILLFTHDCSRSGAPIVLRNMARALRAWNKAEIVIISKAGGPLHGEFLTLAPTIVLGQNTASPDASAHLEAILGTKLMETVVAALCSTIVTADILPTLKRFNIPIISLVHELPTSIRYFGTETIHTIDKTADAIVFGSRFVRDTITKEFNCSNSRQVIIPTGYPQISRAPAFVLECRRRLRREAGISENAFVVLGCGYLGLRKGVDLFVQTARLVEASLPGRCIHFVWIGPPDTKDYEHWLKHDVAASNVSDLVHLIGPREDTDLYLPGADVFLMCSREDPFPLVSLAAMSSAIPIVTFAGAGGTAEMITSGGGVAVPYLDVVAMAEATVLLAMRPDHRYSMGMDARAVYDANYRMEIFMKRIMDLLNDVTLGELPDFSGR